MLSGEQIYLTLTYLDNTYSVWQPLFRLYASDILRYVKTVRVTGVYPGQNSRSASSPSLLPPILVPILFVLALPQFSQKP